MHALLKVVNLYKQYGQKEAIANVSFSVFPGEVHGLLGPNGAGKTTIIMVILGILPPTSGEVILFGQSVSRPYTADIKKRLGFLADTPLVYDYLTGAEFMKFIGDAYGVKNGFKAAEKLLQDYGLWETRDELIVNYSRGMKQRLALAGIMLHQSDFLVLDEPTVGLDVESQYLLKEKIRAFAQAGKGVLLATHTLSFAETVCSSVTILNKRVYFTGPVARLKQAGQQTLEEIFIKLISGTPPS